MERDDGSSREEPDEANLAARFRAGDEAAFRELFDRHGPLLLGRIRRLVPARLARKVSLADILQEARIVAHRRREDFIYRGLGSWRNWLLGIVDHMVRDTVRRYLIADKRAAARELSRGLRPDTAQFRGRAPSPSQVAIGAELAERVRRAVEQLPADYREVIRLAREEGLSLREVAVRMGRSREATKKLYARALLKFRELLGLGTGDA